MNLAYLSVGQMQIKISKKMKQNVTYNLYMLLVYLLPHYLHQFEQHHHRHLNIIYRSNGFLAFAIKYLLH